MADDLDQLLDELGVDANIPDSSEPFKRLHGVEYEDLSDLAKILLACCPPNEDNVVSFRILADNCEVTGPAIYNIIQRERITYKRAKQILGFQDLFTEEPIYSIEDLEPYIM